jgi:hypothetical protein
MTHHASLGHSVQAPKQRQVDLEHSRERPSAVRINARFQFEKYSQNTMDMSIRGFLVSRKRAAFVRNTVAIQTGYDPSHAHTMPI